MGKQQTEQFINDYVGVPTLALLSNYMGRGIEARTFMLREHEKLLRQVWNREGHYFDYSEEDRIFVESGFYIELLERICLLIEDYAVIVNALCGDLRRFPLAILHQPAPDKILKQFNSSTWETVLRYRPIKEFHLELNEHIFIEKVRAERIAFLNNFNDLLISFLDYSWMSFTKHKHGNTLLRGLPAIRTGGERGVLIPVVYDSKDLAKTKGVLVTPTMYEKWKTLTDALVLLLKDLISLTITHTECAGVLFCVGSTYGVHLSSDDLEWLRTIETKCYSGIEHVKVAARLEITIEERAHKKARELIDRFDVLFPAPA